MPKKSSSKKPIQEQENGVVEQAKPSSTPKKTGNEIDEIFSEKKRKPEQKKADKVNVNGEEKPKSMKKKIKEDEEGRFTDPPSEPRKKTEDGFKIYTEEELGFNKSSGGEGPGALVEGLRALVEGRFIAPAWSRFPRRDMQYTPQYMRYNRLIDYLVQEARKAAKAIREGVDETRHIMANKTLNLCRGGLEEVGEGERLEIILADDEIAYRGRVGDVGPSTSDPGLSSSVLGPSSIIPGPPTT